MASQAWRTALPPARFGTQPFHQAAFTRTGHPMASSGEIEKLERRWLENPLGLTFAPLAEAYRKAGDTAKALELIDIGLAQHPNYVPAHIVRGRCHLDTQADPAAELAFLKVTELDPENV